MTHVEDNVDELVDLNEVITLPTYDLNNITLEKMHELQILLSWKAKQEQLKKEQRRRQSVLYTVRDIFIDVFGITDVNHQHTIFGQLVYVVDKF